jgi:hypothetical protein
MKKLNLLVLIFLTSGIFPQILTAAQYNKYVDNQTPFIKDSEYNSPYHNAKPKTIFNSYSANAAYKQAQQKTQQMKAQTQTQTQTQTQSQARIQTQAQARVQTQAQTQTQTRIQTQAQAQTQTQAQTRIQTQAPARVQIQPQQLQQSQKTGNNKTQRTQQNNSVTKNQLPPRPNSQPKFTSSPQTDLREVQFSGELFDMRILDSDDNDELFNANDSIIPPKRIPESTIIQAPIDTSRDTTIDGDEFKSPLKVITPIKPNHVPSAGFLRYSEEYPDPQSIGRITPYSRGGIGATHYDSDRVGAIPEEEVHHRYHVDQTRQQLGQPPVTAAECPLCKDDPKTPCGECKKCKLGYPCERTVCRHCVQPLSRDMNNFCDLTAGGEPCGTCDSCREHRSDPCEHADDGHGPHGEWNPYKEPRLFSVIPRPILDEWNNGARKFPVYYNPAPYYRHYWNPSLYTGYARPYTFRYTCPVCSGEVCKCDKPPFAGQVPFAYTCKFCNRNPCACAEDICDANAEMKPSGRNKAVESARSESTRIQDADARKTNETKNNSQDENTDSNSTTTIPNQTNKQDNENTLDDLLNEKPSTPTRETTPPTPHNPDGKRPSLDGPKTQTPSVVPRTSVIN